MALEAAGLEAAGLEPAGLEAAGLEPAGLEPAGAMDGAITWGFLPLTTLPRKVSKMDFIVARSAGATPAAFMTSKITPLKSSKCLSLIPIL